MRLAVLGAGGRTGRLAVAEALRREHDVVAVLRDPGRLDLRAPRLEVRAADATDEAALTDALRGVDAVVSAIGRPSTSGSRRPVFAPAAQATLAAMRANGAGRLSVISAQGVGEESDDGLALPLRLMRRLLGATIDDMRAMERLIAESDLQWTIVRAGGLTGRPKGRYVVAPGNALRGHGRTRRADLAEALVLAVTEDRWPRQAVVVAS
jgi:putative NADH-flavin reductase